MGTLLLGRGNIYRASTGMGLGLVGVATLIECVCGSYQAVNCEDNREDKEGLKIELVILLMTEERRK